MLGTGTGKIDLLGAGLMLGSAALYGLHLIINQRVLYEVPAQTVTLYTLIAMAATVALAYIVFDRGTPPPAAPWWPLLGMALLTFMSRMTLFLGIKHLGGLQTALLGLGELIVTVALANLWLKEQLTPLQWLGAIMISSTILLVGFDKITPEKRRTGGWLAWISPTQVSSGDYWKSQL